VIPTVQVGNVQLPLSGAGVLPTILPSGSSNVPGVTLGNNTTLSGFAINNATDVGIGNEGSAGTGLNPISNVTIRDNQIVGSGTEGIRLTSVTGAINLFNNTVTNSGVLSGGDGIRIANRSGQANVTITGNNQITENNGTGIAFLLNDTAQVSSTISGNTVSNNALDGIFFDSLIGNTPDLVNSVQLNNVRISENTIASNGTRNSGSGIVFTLGRDRSANNITIVGNQILTNNGVGILFSLVENAQATATISANTISGNLNIGSTSASGIGIGASTFDNSTLRLLIDSNLISNNQSSGIFLQANDSSNIFSTVSNNTLTNNHINPIAGSSFGATGNFVAQSVANTKVCLNLANNTSISPNPAGADFNFFIGNNNMPSQFIYSASGNTPTTINFLFAALPISPAPQSLFTTPLGSCPVP
jgi:hypothetical protein